MGAYKLPPTWARRSKAVPYLIRSEKGPLYRILPLNTPSAALKSPFKNCCQDACRAVKVGIFEEPVRRSLSKDRRPCSFQDTHAPIVEFEVDLNLIGPSPANRR